MLVVVVVVGFAGGDFGDDRRRPECGHDDDD